MVYDDSETTLSWFQGHKIQSWRECLDVRGALALEKSNIQINVTLNNISSESAFKDGENSEHNVI